MDFNEKFQQWRERRQGYSLRGHLKRLKAAGRLPQVAWGTAFMVVVTGTALARCQSESISGPAERPADQTSAQTGASMSVGVSGEKTAVAVFPSDLLPAYHPCHADLTFVEMGGQASWTYTDEWTTDANGNREHTVRYKPQTSQRGKDKNGKEHKGGHFDCPSGDGKDSRGNCFFKTSGAPGNRKHSTHHMSMQADQEPDQETCTTQLGPGSSGTHSGGNNCNPQAFTSSPTFEMVLVEDPLTHEGTLIVTTLSVASSCPSATVVAAPSTGEMVALN